MSNIKTRTFSIGLLALLLAGVTCAGATTVSIANTTVEPSGVITIPIVIGNITDYGTGTIYIEYNSSVVHVNDVTSGPKSQIAAHDADNTIGLALISALNSYGASGDIIFANVTFKAIDFGSTPVNLDVTLLGDTSYKEIPATVNNGSIEIALGSIPGDVNDDKELTTSDAVIVLGMATRGEYSQIADVNGDHAVTSLDALMILQTLTCEEYPNKS
ncbi:MAG TPA: hypothetical protein ENF23_04215 [Methanosarcinales archaeon]|nr:MAG: hypothetical protein DRO03_09720 [Methanosarcinales archaeon]HDN65490.1 hypothetical protein [Methanosarcinales archaeon]